MDDQGLTPIAPTLDNFDELPAEDKVSPIDVKISKAYFHPSWEGVEEMLMQEIEQLRLPVDEKKEANEFKIESIANRKAGDVLTKVVARVKDAVTAVHEQEQSSTESRGA